MNLFEVADFYLGRLVNPQVRTTLSVVEQSRIRVLLLDKSTTQIISMTATQTELLNKEIYMIDTIENEDRDVMRHLSCICYVKPTQETIEYLLKELQDPKYGRYQIFFNNTVTKTQLERLAECDDFEVVTKVEELFQDYYIVNEDLYSLNLPMSKLLSNPVVWDPRGLDSVRRGIVSLLLSLKVHPRIYYESSNKLCGKLAKEIQYEIDKNVKTLFDFPRMDAPPILLLLDRYNDALTPLLQPWTYQSMVHEYIGIKDNLVDLVHVPDLEDSLKQVVLSSKHDVFFRETMYLNFGDLGDRVKQYVTQYKTKTNTNAQINTIEDIKRFIEKFPEFKKLSSNVSKHMAILSELDSQLQLRDIWQLSELEQNLSAHDDNNNDYQEMLKLLQSPNLKSYYKTKLACIYALRNTSETQKTRQVESILRVACSPQEVAIFHKFKATCGMSAASSKKPQENDLISGLSKKFNKISRNNAENVYMQHTPELARLLGELSKNKLPTERLRSVDHNGPHNVSPIQDVIIFMVGGVTLDEARVVHQFNETMKAQNGSLRVVLGGNDVLRTEDFLRDFEDIFCTSGKDTELSDLL
ncbi:Vps45p Ecym_2242 [Eremothecium cymbalariae DBVPG|uniref:Vacuolar protein sorting-associated protein 45 n=1 Tax=Eremothecium cymbalariae (strain CBS 270.75 / DBVPG 7215 / KCTC 17166 / NRRL Y-17582) TaxID=931890 RepID=G8JPN4_ERECY|nr:Hypothetical protein Ecym_2242 [Eremothecium cymbalariae DBVPG\